MTGHTTSASANKSEENPPLLEVTGLKKYFSGDEGLFSLNSDTVKAVDGVDISIGRGETYGLVGESGSGKTTIGKTILRIIEPTAGTIKYDGDDLTEIGKSELRSLRTDIQIVFQDPTSSLNPKKRVVDIVSDPLKVHDIGSRGERERRVEELLAMVDIPLEYLYKYPTALSGGQKQRIAIARAIATDPKFVVLDEPTSSLDVSVQARVINILQDIQDELDITYLYITHNLPLIKSISDRIGVLYLGELVEEGRVDDVFTSPKHPYTRALLSSIQTVDEEFPFEKMTMSGEIPDPVNKPSGCSYRTRCPMEFGPCSDDAPPDYDVGSEHSAKCYLHDDSHDGPVP